MELKAIKLDIPEGLNIILGQAHFIKTVEDLYEALISSSISIKFGIAFAEASGKALIRHDGNDKELEELAVKELSKLAAGHSFLIVLKDGFPINVLNRIKMVEEVVNIYCATANPVEVIIIETEQGRGILGVVDGIKSKGVEGDEDKRERYEFLRKIGYKK
ncbi:MAG: membrane protein [Candidatus Nitrosocaldaceae archaeon]|nr:MAG: membrane protein [Candidatus Nitrosocaldaceae archaeon]